MLGPALNHSINCTLETLPSVGNDFKITFSFAS